ncbi:MAG: UXX-star (seleno)protein family 2 [Chloroflexota bacterium]|nr:UXX-star (seleno)protein family 2 [Chloroflexota bacterium]MDE2842256.1 UXX-star (seleno)protein family 2 [Chloroflexota bacterium]
MTTENTPDIVIYTHPDCSFSAAAKMDYRRSKTAYTEIDLAKQPDQIPALLELTNGERVTPVIVQDGTVTIGFKGGY